LLIKVGCESGPSRDVRKVRLPPKVLGTDPSVMTPDTLVCDILRKAPNLPRPEDVGKETVFVLCPACDELRSLANSVLGTGQAISYRCVECNAELIRITSPQLDVDWMEDRGYRWDDFFVRPMGYLHFGGLKLRPKPLATADDSRAQEQAASPRPGGGRPAWTHG
jgi:hypothetical protein